MRRTAATLLICVLALVSIGLVMLAGVSTIRAQSLGGDPYYFIRRQLQWLVLAVPVLLLASRFDYHWLQRPWLQILLLVGTLAGLAAVFVPGLGIRLYGSARWIGFAGLRVQPSEFAKLSVVVMIAAWLDRIGWRVRNFIHGFAIPALALALILGLIIAEPDFGATALIGAFAFGIMLIGGVRLRYLVFSGLVALALFSLMVWMDPVRLNRVMAFWDAEGNLAVAHQLRQSRAALASGGFFGVGLANSIQKHLYLPEAHTDFIFAIIGEELGFVGALAVLLLFAVIVFCGAKISAQAPDVFGQLLAFGMTLIIGLQAVINIGVVTGLMPTKGLALPFISYGGSSLVASMLAVGILLNVLKHVEMAARHNHTSPIKNSVRRL